MSADTPEIDPLPVSKSVVSTQRVTERLKRLGEIIRTARENQPQKMTQIELAAIVGVRQSYVSDIERGYVNPARGPVRPSDETLNAFAGALNIDIAALHGALGRRSNMEDDYDEHEVIDYLRGQPEPLKDKALKMLKAAFDEEDAKDNAGNFGKRAE